MRAELDLFSGRPNPSWEITAEESAELVKWLKTLPEANEGAVRDRLGYRGIVVTTTGDELADLTSLVASAGIVLVRDSAGTKRLFVDPGRALERWLLGTARGRVDPAILASIDGELEHENPPTHPRE
jgi:hypothetical protein